MKHSQILCKNISKVHKIIEISGLYSVVLHVMYQTDRYSKFNTITNKIPVSYL